MSGFKNQLRDQFNSIESNSKTRQRWHGQFRNSVEWLSCNAPNSTKHSFGMPVMSGFYQMQLPSGDVMRYEPDHLDKDACRIFAIVSGYPL